jgi:glycosyltransferase involved in cell wall biosynthesis
VLKAGGDVRTAMILQGRPDIFPSPIIFASKSAISAFRETSLGRFEGHSIDNTFDDISGNLVALSILLWARILATIVALFLTEDGRSTRALYSTSNSLPDVLVCALSKLLFRRQAWVAVVHHIPQNNTADFGTVFQRLLSKLTFAIALRIIAEYADLVVAYHAPTIARLQALGVTSDRLRHNSNGVDLGEIEVARATAPPRRPNTVLCMGRLSPQKGTLAMMRIWSEVIHSKPDAKLTLIGADDTLTRTTVTNVMQSLGLVDSVKLKGVVSRTELLSEMLSTRLVGAPSFVEGWGISVLESLACGTPVVAWNLEAYSPFRPAVIEVQVSDTTAFATQIIRMLDNDNEWNTKSTISIQISKEYSWHDVSDREWKILSEVLD